MTEADQAFIIQHTRLQCPSLIPELRLYLASDIMPLWQQVAKTRAAPDPPPPYWASAWPGGQAIARYLLDHPDEVAGKRVVDVATGSGLCALAAARAGAAEVLAADIDPFAATAVALNACANNMRLTFTDRDLLAADPPNVDVITAGDLCYERVLASRALPWLRMAHERRIRVLIGDPGRDFFSYDSLMQLAGYQVTTLREIEGVESKQAAVFTFA